MIEPPSHFEENRTEMLEMNTTVMLFGYMTHILLHNGKLEDMSNLMEYYPHQDNQISKDEQMLSLMGFCLE